MWNREENGIEIDSLTQSAMQYIGDDNQFGMHIQQPIVKNGIWVAADHEEFFEAAGIPASVKYHQLYKSGMVYCSSKWVPSDGHAEDPCIMPPAKTSVDEFCNAPTPAGAPPPPAK